jgi:hypothetical protein
MRTTRQSHRIDIDIDVLGRASAGAREEFKIVKGNSGVVI